MQKKAIFSEKWGCVALKGFVCAIFYVKRPDFVLVILEGVLEFYNACGAGERQPPAVFFPKPHLFRPLGVKAGCKGDTDIGALR